MIGAAYSSPKKLTYTVLLVYLYISFGLSPGPVTVTTRFIIFLGSGTPINLHLPQESWEGGQPNISQDIFLQSCFGCFCCRKTTRIQQFLSHCCNPITTEILGVFFRRCDGDTMWPFFRWMVRFACRIPDDF